MNHHLQSLGWTLVHFCWQAAAIALAYWLADFALSKTRSQTRYLLALGAMLLMLSCALSTFAYEETHANSELSSPGALSIVANAAGGSSISADLAPRHGSTALVPQRRRLFCCSCLNSSPGSISCGYSEWRVFPSEPSAAGACWSGCAGAQPWRLLKSCAKASMNLRASSEQAW